MAPIADRWAILSRRRQQPLPTVPEGHWPAVFGRQAERLRSAWFQATLAKAWTSAEDWWTPAVDAVVECVASGREVDAALRRLGRARAAIGACIEETMDDVQALAQVTRTAYVADMIRSVACGWAEAGLEPVNDAGCVDAVTGLATPSHLEARINELYRDVSAGVEAAACFQLVVVDLGPMDLIAETYGGTSAGDPWATYDNLFRYVEAMRRVFNSGQVLARLAPGRICALTRSGPQLGRQLGELEELLAVTDRATVSSMWVEALPKNAALIGSLLTDLGR